MKIFLLVLITSLAVFGSSFDARAGMAIPVEIKDLRGKGSVRYSTTLYVEGQRIKLDTTRFKPGGEKTELIYRGDAKRAYYVDHSEKSYIELDEEMATGLASRIEVLLERLSGNTGSVPEKKSAPRFEIRKTDAFETLLKTHCRRYDVFQGDHRIQEVWIAPWKEAGIRRDAFSGLRRLAVTFDKVMSVLGHTPFLKNVEYVPMGPVFGIDGYPVSLKHFKGKRLIFDIRLRFPRPSRFPPAFFSIPRDYTRTWALG